MEMDRETAAEIIGCLGWGYTDGEIKEAVHLAQQALRESDQHPQERDIPVKVKADRVWNTFRCPNCQRIYGDDEHEVETLKYCPNCGRPLEWEAEK